MVPLAHGDAAGATEMLGWLLPLAVVTLPALAYAVGVGRWLDGGRAWPVRRTLLFLTGLLTVAAALTPTVDALAHDDPRWHMVQHLALGMVAPIGLVLGAPLTLLLGASSGRGRRALRVVLGSRPVHLLGRPLVAAVLTTGSLYLLYLTPLYAWSTRSDLVHHLLHAHFLLAGHLYVWSLVGPDPAPGRPRIGPRLAALVLAAGGHAHLAKLLYARADARVVPLPGDDPLVWQQAALWMYYGGDVVEVAVAALLFAAWYRRSSLLPVIPGGSWSPPSSRRARLARS